MHTLVNYLVRIPDAAEQTVFNETDRCDAVSALRLYVEDQTECYRDDIFDWRETITAGGWQDEYPENVLFAADDPEAFVARLAEIQNRQREAIDGYLHQIAEICGTTDLEKIVCQRLGTYGDLTTSWLLCQLADELNGRFTSKSEFYNCESGTSIITDKTLDAIRQNPEEWAVVLFDQHS